MNTPKPQENTPSSPETEVPCLTFIPSLHAVHITGLSGEDDAPDQFEHVWPSRETAENVSEYLPSMYNTLGEGVFSLNEIHERTGMHKAALMRIGEHLGKVLPAQVFGYETGDSIRLGAFTVQRREATQEELAAKAERERLAQTEAFSRKKQEIEAAEAGKRSLVDADHSLITANGRRYYMPIETADAIVALRTLAGVRDMSKAGRPFGEISKLVKTVWGAMPIEERALFTDSEKIIYGHAGAVIDKLVKTVLSDVAARMRIARKDEPLVGFIQGASVTIEIKREPPETPYDTSVYTPIFPPGTAKEVAQQSTLGEISAEELAAVGEVLNQVVDNPHLSHRKAINIIDLLMNRRSKILARRILSAQYGAEHVDDMLDLLDKRALSVLEEDRYAIAQADRSMQSFGKLTRQSPKASGRLPGRLFTQGDESNVKLTKRWYFGIQSKQY